MSGYTLTGVETTLIIERSETNLNPVISSLDDSYMYINTGIEILTNKYQGLSMDSENIHNLITELRQVFTGKSPKSSVLQGGDERRTLLKNLQECYTINP